MTFSDDTYSRFVNWAKIILPILALGLLSSLFLVSGRVDVTQSVPYAELNVDQIISEQRISRPFFTGVIGDGTQVQMLAAYARPDAYDANITHMANPEITLRAQNHSETHINANTAVIDSHDETVLLEGGADIQNSAGYRLTTHALQTDMAHARTESLAPVQGTTPFGAFEAGKMIVYHSAKDDRILFTGGVHLVYHPR